jgi:chemotaxis protein methyltransferase CheR
MKRRYFRDKTPFIALETEVSPKLLDSRRAGMSLRIWCAVAATGQEPYSLAMLLDEKSPELNSWNVESFATDISEQILEKARAGLYTQFEVQRGLPVQLLMKYFKQVENGWQVKKPWRDGSSGNKRTCWTVSIPSDRSTSSSAAMF